MGLHLALGHVVVVAVESHKAAPQGTEGDDHFVQARAPGGEVLAGLVELLLAPADADAEARTVFKGRRSCPR